MGCSSQLSIITFEKIPQSVLFDRRRDTLVVDSDGVVVVYHGVMDGSSGTADIVTDRVEQGEAPSAESGRGRYIVDVHAAKPVSLETRSEP